MGSGGPTDAGFSEGHRHGIGRLVVAGMSVGIVVGRLSVIGLVIGTSISRYF